MEYTMLSCDDSNDVLRFQLIDLVFVIIQEAQNGIIDLSKDNPETVEALLKFVYQRDYPRLLHHARIYATGDCYVPDLMKLTKSYSTEDGSLLQAIIEVYDTTTEGHRGLRDSVVRAVQIHFKTAMSDKTSVDEVWTTVAEFSLDVAKAFHAKTRINVPHRRSMCEECRWYTIDRDTLRQRTRWVYLPVMWL